MVNHAKAQEVIDFLLTLCADETREDPLGQAGHARISPAQGNRIAAFIAERGGYDLFVELDERPGQFDAGPNGLWHWKLRQARNDRRNQFFDRLNDR